MGVCHAKTPVPRHLEIDNVLLLGDHGVGKSTIGSAFHLLVNDVFSLRVRKESRRVIISNCINLMELCLKEACSSGCLSPSSAELVHVFEVNSIDPKDHLDTLANVVRKLWSDPTIQECFTRFQLTQDTCSGDIGDWAFDFLDKVEEVFDVDYIPTVEDVLKIRRSTFATKREVLELNNRIMCLIDAGGDIDVNHDSSKLKFLGNESDRCSAVLFVASFADYNVMVDNPDGTGKKTSKLRNSLNLYNYLCGDNKFRGVPKICIFNKDDLFCSKIQKFNLKEFFPQYPGPPNDPNSAAQYIALLFQDALFSHTHMDAFYSFRTSATSLPRITETLHDVIELLGKGNLAHDADPPPSTHTPRSLAAA